MPRFFFIYNKNLDANVFLTVVGTFVTTIAFAFGAYFAALAVDMYSQLTSVKNKADEAAKHAEAVAKHMEDVGKIVGQIDKIRGRVDTLASDAKNKVDFFEGEMLDKIGEVLNAVVSFAQKMPSDGKLKLASASLVREAVVIRATFICEKSKNADAVTSALLELISRQGDDCGSVLEKARARFPDNQQIQALCDAALKGKIEKSGMGGGR